MAIVETTGSMVSTLDAANLAYEFEKVRTQMPEVKKRDDLIQNAQRKKVIPNNLEYIDDFYDEVTGTSGTAFKDKDTGKVIIAYSGTNMEADGIKDPLVDLFGIGLNLGIHYAPPYAFYEKMAAKYGPENLILTGHSLGGNIAQRVALRFNAPMTIVYNPAPLYAAGLSPLMLGILSLINIASITIDQVKFSGKVLRVNTQYDPLQAVAHVVGGIYIGREITLANSGGHSIDDIVESEEQTAELKRILAIEFGMSNITDKKLQFIRSSREGISGVTKSQWIYLDALQAQVLSEGLVKANNAAIESFKQTQAKGIQEANELYKELSKVPANSKLSAEEIMAVYYEEGVHYDSIVGDVEEYSNKKLQTAVEIAENFAALGKVINDGIAELVEKDQELSALFVKG
ncbi:hypothetical protein [uncultured Granulicatella sp.]|uniref:hypothetical protein n=1 Tax=uncultured Granulicatella sp. TaxID=316089 RepID=UPI002594CE45|nr:hypothetical protein [uncultured Granulicatella sp.]